MPPVSYQTPNKGNGLAANTMVLTMSGLPASTAVATSATERKIAEQTRAGLMREGAQSLSSSIQISPMDKLLRRPRL